MPDFDTYEESPTSLKNSSTEPRLAATSSARSIVSSKLSLPIRIHPVSDADSVFHKLIAGPDKYFEEFLFAVSEGSVDPDELFDIDLATNTRLQVIRLKVDESNFLVPQMFHEGKDVLGSPARNPR
ncbi:hypothetical protein MPER_10756 [Moniliophthora perniciosa FA553]|nr:hypothetical protein MPER_10756 [Moniliophthora perniciosa FA553]